MKISLKRHGYDVCVFDDPINALDYFKQNPYHFEAIISDVRMPGMSGIELSSKIKEIKPEVKVFLMTAYDIDTFKEEINSLDWEIVEIFQKPMSFVKMSEKVVKHIGINR